MSGATAPQMDEFFRKRGYGQTLGFGTSPAVLVVDVMCAFTDPNHPLGAAQDAEVAETCRLLAAARAHAVPVLFSIVQYDEPGGLDGGLWRLKVPGNTTLLAGTPGVELDPRLERRPDEPIIAKKYASSFFGTDLTARLNARGIDTLIITGCTTSGCVRATVVDAIQWGFRPTVALEAVADRSAAAHQQSLFDMAAKYADVLPVQQILDYLNQRGSQPA